MFKKTMIAILLAAVCGLTFGAELREAQLPPGLEGLPDQEIFFPRFKDIQAGQWALYEQEKSGRPWKLEYKLTVKEVSASGYYLLEAVTRRPYETIIQKWRIDLRDGKILDYWLNSKGRKPRRIPIMDGANNTELIAIINPTTEKNADRDEPKWYTVVSPAGTFKCRRVTGVSDAKQSVESFLSEDVPLFQVVKQEREGMSIQLKAFGRDN